MLNSAAGAFVRGFRPIRSILLWLPIPVAFGVRTPVGISTDGSTDSTNVHLRTQLIYRTLNAASERA
ncbi:hypothetical protein [Haladaptatus halobius]|uniref:hypothetical protein n=1 Tax=Haladaptatus halobius TaxID=2884875 RepID=UPI001D0BADEB|nr:hypothetical protein [Haladaptatus halobius]